MLPGAWSRDGRRIAFTAAEETHSGSLWVMKANGDDPHGIAVSPEGLAYTLPTWSRRSVWLAFSYVIEPTNGYSTGFIGLVKATGKGPIHRIKAGIDPWQPDWSRDGRKIVFSERHQTIKVLDVRTRKVRALAEGQDPSWSPNGRKIVFTCELIDICVMNANGSHVVRATHR